jgi:hypothetical protein
MAKNNPGREREFQGAYSNTYPKHQKSQPQRRSVQQNSPTAALESFWFVTAIRFLVAAVATAAAFWLLAFVHGFWA